MDKNEMTANLENSNIIEIWRDGVMSAQACQESQYIWHLNAISEFKFPPKNRYPYDTPQPDATVYVLDSWMDISHPEFENRASRGPAFETGEGSSHATHVGSSISGKTYGVNKNARVVSVQVLNGNGYGSWSNIIRGMNFVNGQKKKTIVNMSIGGGKSDAVNKVVDAMVRNGWKMVVAAGNENSDACESSPASASLAVTVGAYNDRAELAGFSNWGKCLDILAPGEGIVGACPNRQICYMSGTSMAAPQISGILSLHPDWSVERLLNRSRTGKIKVPSQTTDRAGVCRQKSSCNNLEYLDIDTDEYDGSEFKLIVQ
jgi:serine protease